MERALRFNNEDEVVMEGIMTLKKKGSLRSTKQEGFCILNGSTFQMFGSGVTSADNAPPPLVEAVITAVRSWDDELCGLIAQCSDGKELFLTATNQFELGVWGRGMAIAIDPEGTEAKALRKELKRGKKKAKKKEEEKLKKLAEMSEKEKKRADAVQSHETQRVKSEDAKALEDEELRKGRAEARKKAQDRNKSKQGLRTRNRAKQNSSTREKNASTATESAAPSPVFAPAPAPAASIAATPTPVAVQASAGSGVGDEKFAPYYKMQKCGLPDGPIRQKMSADGMGDADIATFFGGGASASGGSAAGGAAAAAGSSGVSDEKFAPYFKMKKMGLPDGPIRQKMSADGMGDADIATFFGGGASAGGGSAAGGAAAPPPPPKTAGRSAMLGAIAARRVE
jgi:hypothetical protein